MIKYFSSKLIPGALLLLGILLSQSASSNLLHFKYRQGGFEGGAFVEGSFSGEDLNGDGVLKHQIDGEITGFSFNFFTGTTSIPGISLTFNKNSGQTLDYGLIYDLNGGSIGDGDINGEGIAVRTSINPPITQNMFPDGFFYRTAGAAGQNCGIGETCAVVRICSPGNFALNCAGLEPTVHINPLNREIFSSELVHVEAVPIPATIWLFGSAILGLFGARKSRMLL